MLRRSRTEQEERGEGNRRENEKGGAKSRKRGIPTTTRVSKISSGGAGVQKIRADALFRVGTLRLQDLLRCHGITL
jgi:hypothetical protein